MIISRIGLSMAWKDSTSTMSASELRAMRYKQDFIHITTTVEVEERIDGPDEYAKRKLGSPTWPVGVMVSSHNSGLVLLFDDSRRFFSFLFMWQIRD